MQELNKERYKHNLPLVRLINSSIAQLKAELLIKYDWEGHTLPPSLNFSFYVPPHLMYTYLGEKYYIEENILNGYEAIVSLADMQSKAKDAIHRFIYEDEESGWGHRDSLLSPCHNAVAVGIDWKGDDYRIVLHMTGIWINYTISPTYENDVFKVSGYIDKRFEIDPTNSVFILLSFLR